MADNKSKWASRGYLKNVAPDIMKGASGEFDYTKLDSAAFTPVIQKLNDYVKYRGGMDNLENVESKHVLSFLNVLGMPERAVNDSTVIPHLTDEIVNDKRFRAISDKLSSISNPDTEKILKTDFSKFKSLSFPSKIVNMLGMRPKNMSIPDIYKAVKYIDNGPLWPMGENGAAVTKEMGYYNNGGQLNKNTMSTNFAQRAKDIVAKHGKDKKAILAELDMLRREQFTHEQQLAKGGNLNIGHEIKRGVEVEKEHAPTLEFAKQYLAQNGQLPPLEKFAKSIATDHEKDFKNLSDDPRRSYYKSLINNGLSDEVSRYASGGNLAPVNIPDAELETIRMMNVGGPIVPGKMFNFGSTLYPGGGELDQLPLQDFNNPDGSLPSSAQLLDIFSQTNPALRGALNTPYLGAGLRGVAGMIGFPYDYVTGNINSEAEAIGGMVPGMRIANRLKSSNLRAATKRAFDKNPAAENKSYNQLMGELSGTSNVKSGVLGDLDARTLPGSSYTPSAPLDLSRRARPAYDPTVAAQIRQTQTEALRMPPWVQDMINNPVAATSAVADKTGGFRAARSARELAGQSPLRRRADIYRQNNPVIERPGVKPSGLPDELGPPPAGQMPVQTPTIRPTTGMPPPPPNQMPGYSQVGTNTPLTAPAGNTSSWRDLIEPETVEWFKNFKANPYIKGTAITAGVMGGAGYGLSKIPRKDRINPYMGPLTEEGGIIENNLPPAYITPGTPMPGYQAPVTTPLTVPATTPHSGRSAQSGEYTKLIQKYFPPEQWDMAHKVMQGESDGNPIAENINKPGLGKDTGLFQINDRFHPEAYKNGDMTNPEQNIREAARIWAESEKRRGAGKGWNEWTSYQNKIKAANTPAVPVAQTSTQPVTPTAFTSVGTPSVASEDRAASQADLEHSMTGAPVVDPQATTPAPRSFDWNNAMRYTPIAANALSGLLTQRSKPMSENFSLPTISPTLISPEQLSTDPTRQALGSQYKLGVDALAGAAGGSGAAMRSGLSGMSLAGARGAGEAYNDIYAKNAMLRGDATKYNATATDRANMINLDQATKSLMMARENEQFNRQDEAEFQQQRRAGLLAAATGIGQVGKENKQIEMLKKIYKYDSQGNRINYGDEDKAAAAKARKIAMDKRTAARPRDWLNRVKVGKMPNSTLFNPKTSKSGIYNWE